MTSPYVRRYRVCTELVALRKKAGLTHTQLGQMIGKDRQQISRLENGRALDLDMVMQILEALDVEGDHWKSIYEAAKDAATRGWWEAGIRTMGERQALFADLEDGALTIRQYSQAIVPGLLQTPEYIGTRLKVDTTPLPRGMTKEGIVKGRAGRQRALRQPGGGRYEGIINEFAVRRRSAPPAILSDQLRHLAEKTDGDRTTIRVLAIEAEVPEYNLPVTSFSAFTYSDPGDPEVVAIEGMTSDVVLTEPDQTERHLLMFERLRDAAMSPEASREFLTEAADRLSAE